MSNRSICDIRIRGEGREEEGRGGQEEGKEDVGRPEMEKENRVLSFKRELKKEETERETR